MTNRFIQLSSKLANLIKQPCVLCGAQGESALCLCLDCLNELPFIDNSCQTCGIPTQPNINHCGACLSKPPPNTLCISLLHYQEPVDHLIKRMKYQNQLSIADSLGKLLSDKIHQTADPLPDLIIPVPLHPKRLQQRGYNQATEIARPISKAFNIPVNLRSCIRKLNTTPQFDLPPKQRMGNMRNAFEVTKTIPAEHVAIIDDVMTTGSTVWALSQAILEAGVKRVDIWTCARTVTH